MTSDDDIGEAIRERLGLTARQVREYGSTPLFEPTSSERTAELVRGVTRKAIMGFLKDRGMDPERCPEVTSRHEDGKIHVAFASNDIEVMRVLSEVVLSEVW